MTDKTKSALRRRWSLFGIITIALFWGLYSLIFGDVPKLEHIKFAFWDWPLRFAISRWWDIVSVPFLVLVLVWFIDEIFFPPSSDNYRYLPVAFGGFIIGVIVSSDIAAILIFNAAFSYCWGFFDDTKFEPLDEIVGGFLIATVTASMGTGFSISLVLGSILVLANIATHVLAELMGIATKDCLKYIWKFISSVTSKIAKIHLFDWLVAKNFDAD